MVDDHDEKEKQAPIFLPSHEAGMLNDRVRTLQLLRRIAQVLDQPIEDFFTRPSDSKADPDGSGGLRDN